MWRHLVNESEKPYLYTVPYNDEVTKRAVIYCRCDVNSNADLWIMYTTKFRSFNKVKSHYFICSTICKYYRVIPF